MPGTFERIQQPLELLDRFPDHARKHDGARAPASGSILVTTLR